MISVLFVCLGNICRSPMAELIFKKMVEERGLALSFEISSRGTSDEEEGNPLYAPAARVLREHGVGGAHRAVQLTKKRGYKRRLCSGDGLFEPVRRFKADGRRIRRKDIQALLILSAPARRRRPLVHARF